MTSQTQVAAELNVVDGGTLETSTAAEFPEVERYELRAGPAYQFEPGRRGFLQTLGAGIAVFAAVNPASGQQRRRGGGPQPRRDELLSQRFHISGEGIVTVFTSKVEVGQGSRTEITQAAAEELRLPVEQIRVVMADTGTCPDDGGTAGSRTTPATVPRVRSAAAAAIELLAGLAAERLGVKRADIAIADGTFRAGDRQVTLAELAADGDLAEKLRVAPVGDGAKLVPLEDWQVLGTSVAKVGGRDVVTGRAKYPSDIVRPNLVYGKVLRPASYGATLTAIDLEPARRMPGVSVVREGDFVGCTAATSWQAAQAVAALAKTAEWQRPAQIASNELFEYLKRTASARGGERARVDLTVRDPNREIGVEYTAAYIQHAPLEPRAAVAEWEAGNLTVWTGTQQPSRVRQELASAFRLPESRVRVIVPDTGGGFGGKHSGEAAVEAARLAQGAGRPVHLRWTREEEFTWAYFRPAGVAQVAASIDGGGKLARWHFANYNSGQSALDTPYRAADRRTQFLGSDSPLKQGSYRALASTFNTFARESAMDELAALAKADPLAFRLANLDSGRLRDVLLAAAQKFGWGEQRAKQPSGTGVGLACGTEKGSYVAACARVEVRGQTIRVLEVCQAYECGAILNPRNLEAQVAGSIVQGLGGALYEEIEFAEGRIKNPDFASYRVPRLADLPTLTIELLDRPLLPSVGGSETPIIAVAPAVASAVYHAVGVRCRSLPLKLT